MADPNEVDRLRALVALMREGGMTRLALTDGTVLERDPEVAKFELATREAPTEPRIPAAPDTRDDEEKKADAEKDERRSIEQEWNAWWARATRSSGAGIPPFPGPDKASRFLGRYAS